MIGFEGCRDDESRNIDIFIKNKIVIHFILLKIFGKIYFLDR